MFNNCDLKKYTIKIIECQWQYLKEPRSQHSNRRDEDRLRWRRLVVNTNTKVVPDLKACVIIQSSTFISNINVHNKASDLAPSVYLGELMPELIKIREDLSVDFGAMDVVDISQDT